MALLSRLDVSRRCLHTCDRCRCSTVGFAHFGGRPPCKIDDSVLTMRSAASTLEGTAGGACELGRRPTGGRTRRAEEQVISPPASFAPATRLNGAFETTRRRPAELLAHAVRR